jgi:puromycin-sensitive aminopeptidase
VATTGDYRLPRAVLPKDYAIVIDVSPARASFEGRLTLTARVVAPTDTVELNARGLSVSDVVAAAGGRRQKGSARIHRTRETVALAFPKPLPKGPVTIALAFRGKLDKGMHGLYLARDGKERAVVSQCEATDARAIFPCFDEPDLKATLQWTVRAPEGLTVITNGARATTKHERKTRSQVVRFRKTPPLSTYLAALTVGRYEATKARRVNGTPCRVWTSPGALAQGAFAEAVTEFSLAWFEEYFRQKYRYGKLDQVAVPGFDAGAMENAGAIFYRRNLLLMDPASASWRQQKAIAETIAHELSHQWFGNRVTMKWWDDLWLNEAFATWIATKCMDAWKPQWRLWDEFQAGKTRALASDALVNTRSIWSPVESPAEAVEQFDVITYEKGGSVLRMLERFLSEGAFRAGIRAYIDAYKDANASGEDLWAKLGEASGQPVGPMMRTWVAQPGFPVVRVEAAPAPGGGRTALRLSQRRFFANPAEAAKPSDALWQVPLVIRYGTDAGATGEQRTLLASAAGEVTLDAPGAVRWVHANADQVGFYRLDPSRPLLEGLLAHGLPRLTPAERAGLLDDQWALVRNGTSDVARFLDVLAAYAGERDFTVVETMAGRLDFLAYRLVEEAERPAFSRLVARLFAPQLAELGWGPPAGGRGAGGEDQAIAVRRATVIAALGDTARLPEVLSEAERRQPAEQADPKAIEPNLAGLVVRLAARRGDARRFDAYVEAYRARKGAGAPPQEWSRYLYGLTAFEAPDLVRRLLDLVFGGELVPQEQLGVVLQMLLGQRAARLAAWEAVKANWPWLRERVGAMGISRLVRATSGLPYAQREDVARFFAAHPVEEARRALAQALETLDLDEELRRREAGRLAEWLRRESQPIGR